jgi:hypothetical protein
MEGRQRPVHGGLQGKGRIAAECCGGRFFLYLRYPGRDA